MSSAKRNGPSATQDVVEFLREHDLDVDLAGPFREFVRGALAVVHGETSLRSHVDVAEDESTTLHPENDVRTRVIRQQRPSSGPAVLSRPTPQVLLSVRSRREGEDDDAPAMLVHLAKIAAGGMGEIHRVRDRELLRVLALKVLHERFKDKPEMRARFFEEARVTAQLAHPSIPPVHEIGELEDGRPFFTMKEIRGVTLKDIISELKQEEAAESEWSERRLLEVFQKVCDAVAYAHSRGIVHCDLKPTNIMVGAFGEVMVMDWGVARSTTVTLAIPDGEPPVEMDQLESESWKGVAGTPAFMPPEQASGDNARVGPAADVYALGVLLYVILARDYPYRGNAAELLQQSLVGEIPPLPKRTESVVDESLWTIIVKAMSPAPELRYPNAAAMATEISRWREGALRREKALGVVKEAQQMLPEIGPIRARAETLRERAEAALALLGPQAHASDKIAAWELEDQAAAEERAATLRIVEVVQLLLAALVHAPDLSEAKELLARIHFERHLDAEQRRAWDEAARHEILLRASDQGQYRDYLAGTARLSLLSTVPHRVRLFRYDQRGRRLVPELIREFAATPLNEVELPIGSYLLELIADGRMPVRYPIVLRRRKGWDGRAPNESLAHPVWSPKTGEVSEKEAFIPVGWFQNGGDPEAAGARRARWVWLDSYVIQKDPVSFEELGRFLAAPEGAPWRRGVFRDGFELWRPHWPAVGLSWDAARAYAEWYAMRTGLPWRLPQEFEWEKAARGVDGRLFPWGDFGDGTFCLARTVDRAPRTPAGVRAFPNDCSPYGVRNMAGNVRDWCTAAAPDPGTSRSGDMKVVRGGSWRHPMDAARTAARAELPGTEGFPDVGFRLVRSVKRS